MIGDLLKQLIVGLGRYIGYHLGRITGLKAAPQSSETVEPPRSTPERAEEVSRPLRDTILSEALSRPVRWSTSRQDLDREELKLNPAYQIWKQHRPRAHKWSHYFDVYHSVLGSRRTQSLRILEIGVYQGASLRLWRQYFQNRETVIVGIDIDPACAQYASPGENVHVRIGSQADGSFLDQIARDFGPFDVIIDDGSHYSSHLIGSFNHLFAGALKDDGVYLAEDLHTTYWTPWRDTPQSFLDLCKELIELMHAHYDRSLFDEWTRESEAGPDSAPHSVAVPAIATMIGEIRVFDSIVSVHKIRRESMPRILSPSED